MTSAHVVLDFDDSVLPLINDELRIPLQDQQDIIRFGCSMKAFRQFETFLSKKMPSEYGCVFMGSGDYHHVTLILLHLLAEQNPNKRPIDLVVCDNHPDNMRYPLGIHCGSWVYWASKMAYVRNIHVIGISSDDITLKHAWENHLTPFFRKKLNYWSVEKSASWLDKLGFAARHQYFDTPDELVNAFLPVLKTCDNIYLSLDKDVFSQEVVQTNWDQGTFREIHLEKLIKECSGRLVGTDITGDVSAYVYRHWLKKWLSYFDGQAQIDPALMRSWQITQQTLNKKLLAWIHQAMSTA